MTSILATIDHVACRLVDTLSWLLLRMTLVPVSFAALRHGRDVKRELLASPAADGETITQQFDARHVEFIFKFQEDSSAHTDEKVRHLLAVSSSLAALGLAVSGIVLDKQGLAWVSIPLCCSAYLCITFFGIRAYYVPALPDAREKDSQAAWAENLHAAYEGNESFRELRLDVYRGARRWFMVAVASLGVVVVVGAATPRRSESDVDKILGRIGQGVPVVLEEGKMDSLLRQLARIERRLATQQSAIGEPPGSSGHEGVAGQSPVQRGSSAVPETKRSNR